MEKKQKESDVVIAMLAKQLHKKVEDITPNKRIKEDLNADSLDVVEIIMSVEEKYGVTVPDEAVLEVKTVGDLIAMVDKMAAK